jgi:alpha-glucosidase
MSAARTGGDAVTPPRRAARGDRDVEWWRSSVIYQLYVRSFADSDGDGLGDLDGVTARLDHLTSLGVDGLWLNPIYPSPNRDGGYDVADYFSVDERFGGSAAFERLLAAAHERGLKVVMDLVPNHCSDEHAWFQAAIAARPGSAERARFIFADGRGADGSRPPNNWRSTFGGPARTRVPDGQWYLHSFDSSQPDFDWTNLDVAEMFDRVLTTWFDRGIDGFRIDVAYAMIKAEGLPDVAVPDGENPYMWNQPGVHEILKRWRAIADNCERDLTLVGEVWLAPADAAEYVRAGELTQVFFFDLLQQPFEAGAFRLTVAETLASLKRAEGAPTWTLNSHDVHRSVTRYGLVEPEPLATADVNALRTRARGRIDPRLGRDRATAALLFMLALPGSVYLYQGEELGLPEVQDVPDEARQDPIWDRSHHTEYGRDGCRVPLPWSATAPYFGFSTGRPWLPQPEWFADYALDRQHGGDSVLTLYRRALHIRRSLDPRARLDWLETGRDDVLAFRRGSVVNITVFDGPPFEVPTDWGLAVLTTRPPVGRALPSASSGWYRS